MKMEYTAMVRRGWPNDGAIERSELIKAGSTLSNGDWVVKQADGTVDKTPSTASGAGLVVSGNGDSASAANSNKAVVLWSNFIVQISNYDNVPTYVPGSLLTSKLGKLTLVTTTDPVVGTVLDVVVASATATASLIVLVK